MKHTISARLALLLAGGIFISSLTPALAEHSRLRNLHTLQNISAVPNTPVTQEPIAPTVLPPKNPVTPVQPITKPNSSVTTHTGTQVPNTTVQTNTLPKTTLAPQTAAKSQATIVPKNPTTTPQTTVSGKTPVNPAPLAAKPKSNPDQAAQNQQLLSRLTQLEKEVKAQAKAISELQKQSAAYVGRQKALESVSTPKSATQNPKPATAAKSNPADVKTKKVAEKTAPANSKSN